MRKKFAYCAYCENKASRQGFCKECWVRLPKSLRDSIKYQYSVNGMSGVSNVLINEAFEFLRRT